MKFLKNRSSSQISTASLTVVATIVLLCCSACTRPRQTTAVGSGVGGAIGAGLGAIIGNQSGNAGSGVAIGAAAGAATGALIGNALQAQEERTASTEEAMKRQERVMQAQKTEIAELRAMQSDTGASYDATSAATPRYRYRQPSISQESPEVARQRARLQQRGPRPSGDFSRSSYDSYVPRVTRPAVQAPVVRTSETAGGAHKPLARYDVRTELSKSSAPARNVTAQTNAKTTSTKIAEAPKVGKASTTVESAQSVVERDLTIAEPAPAKLSAPAATQSGECKEALSERDLARDASDNSDKLYHLRRALRLCPNNAPLHFELGQVYAAMQRRSDAESEYKEALRIDPNLPAAKKAMSELLKDEVQF